MKKTVRILTLFTLLVFFVVGCGKKEYLKEIDYSEFSKKLDNKDSFILEIVQTGCQNCESFTPKYKSVLERYKIESYSINITYMDAETKESFLDKYGVDGTPTVLFFEKGNPTSTMKRIVGDNDESVIISKLKQNGYINK